MLLLNDNPRHCITGVITSEMKFCKDQAPVAHASFDAGYVARNTVLCNAQSHGGGFTHEKLRCGRHGMTVREVSWIPVDQNFLSVQMGNINVVIPVGMTFRFIEKIPSETWV